MSFVRVGIGTVDTAYIVFHIVAAFFEQFKVMIALEGRDGITDEFMVEGRDKGDKIVFERVANPFFEDIAVDTLTCTVSGVKIRCDKLNTSDSYRWRELEVEHVFETTKVCPKMGKVDVHHLMGRMDSSVCSPRPFRNGSDLEALEGYGERSYDRIGGGGLLLRTHERRTVVAQGDLGTVQKRLPTRRL